MSELIKRSAVHRYVRGQLDRANCGITRVSAGFVETLIDDAERAIVERLTRAIDAHISAPKKGRKRRTLGGYSAMEPQLRLL